MTPLLGTHDTARAQRSPKHSAGRPPFFPHEKEPSVQLSNASGPKKKPFYCRQKLFNLCSTRARFATEKQHARIHGLRRCVGGLHFDQDVVTFHAAEVAARFESGRFSESADQGSWAPPAIQVTYSVKMLDYT